MFEIQFVVYTDFSSPTNNDLTFCKFKKLIPCIMRSRICKRCIHWKHLKQHWKHYKAIKNNNLSKTNFSAFGEHIFNMGHTFSSLTDVTVLRITVEFNNIVPYEQFEISTHHKNYKCVNKTI